MHIWGQCVCCVSCERPPQRPRPDRAPQLYLEIVPCRLEPGTTALASGHRPCLCSTGCHAGCRALGGGDVCAVNRVGSAAGSLLRWNVPSGAGRGLGGGSEAVGGSWPAVGIALGWQTPRPGPHPSLWAQLGLCSRERRPEDSGSGRRWGPGGGDRGGAERPHVRLPVPRVPRPHRSACPGAGCVVRPGPAVPLGPRPRREWSPAGLTPGRPAQERLRRRESVPKDHGAAGPRSASR